MTNQLWGGRFETPADQLAHRLNRSIDVDRRMWREDIAGSSAWAVALGRAGVLSADEVGTLVNGLARVRAEWEAGTFEVAPGDEDIHTAVERRLTELVGPVGGKLHTGRSRNDQVTTDFRLWVMRASDILLDLVRHLQTALVDRAEEHANTLLPGYTHLQRAQPITFGHWLLGHVWALERDVERLRQTRARAAVCPLGSSALAGTAYPIDRTALAAELGFARPSENSLDATGDRDFAVEFLFAAAVLGSHLSRMAEALILYASSEFGFITLADAYSTGSSLMPQKKNPDMLELARGKAGTLLGQLTGLMATLKGLPSAYDKDLQEDKPPVFAAFDTLELLLPVVAGTIATLRVNAERMRAALDPATLATELADYLVRKGLPFREAHHVVGRCVRLAEGRPGGLQALSLEELRTASPLIEADVAEVWRFEAAIARRTVTGGTAPERVGEQILDWRARLAGPATG